MLALYDQRYFNAQDDFIRGTRIYKGGYRDYLGDQDFYQQRFCRRMNEIESYAGDVGRLLEVGCAAGFFLSVARERGWQVEGIEPAEFVAAYARKYFGVTVYNGTLEEFQLAEESYNLVAIWDTLEHLPDPRQTLTRVHELLKPEGLLVISTHDINSWVARIFRTNWYQIGPHLNLYYFSPKTIQNLLTATGFYVINIKRKAAGKVCSFRFLVDKLSAYNQILYQLA
ncbi:MAG: class I SAM-dependent methyltransferase, partial [Anaerolineales bacterium]|nr:class I SAM-dependent methyltransferase [Anaerolineales bacterium]